MIRLEKIIDEEFKEPYYKIRKSRFSSMLLTQTELEVLEKLIRKQLGGE